MSDPAPADRPKTFSEYRDRPYDTCLRCGAELPKRDYITLGDGGRPRRWCDGACRRAASRLRKAHGEDWWRLQPWYPAWADARRQWLAAKEEERRFRQSMPQAVREGYDEAQKRRDHYTTLLKLDIACAAMDFERKHHLYLSSLGAQVRVITRPEGQVERLLRQAVCTGNEQEALAMFTKARELAGGQALDEPESTEVTMSELLNGLF